MYLSTVSVLIPFNSADSHGIISVPCRAFLTVHPLNQTVQLDSLLLVIPSHLVLRLEICGERQTF